MKILKSIASKDYSYAAGSEPVLSKKQANTFIKAGIAKPLEVETATAPTAEETTSKGRKKNADDSKDS